MKTINPDLPVVMVGGRHPLYQKQGTAGFDRSGNYLGEYDEQSEPLATQAVDPDAGQSKPANQYESMKVKPDLLALLASRNIDVPKKYVKSDLIALLVASDNAVTGE